MYRLLIVLLLSLLTACSCASTQKYKVSPDDPSTVRAATVKVEATLTIGRADGRTASITSYGTGWAVASHNSTSMIVTAGHVCLSAGDELPDRDEVFVVSASYRVIARGGDSFTAAIIYDSDEDDDTCVLEVQGWTPRVVLKVSRTPSNERSFGEMVWYVGYPSGHLSVFSGRITGYVEDEHITASMDSYYGASGSAVLDANGHVVGILSAIDPRFTSHVFIVPVEFIWEAERIAMEHLRKLRRAEAR